jgi:ABC-type sugar transport system ATPase subunit
MARLAVSEVSKSYGTVNVLNAVTLAVEEGEFLVLLGPSGCGKSTLLHAIAGLHSIDSGVFRIGETDVTNLPARDRDVAMVFQSYALYPTMSVADNIAFPLKMRGVSTAQRKIQVMDVARLLKIEALLDRLPRQLSGGQRQRVAIGRALVRDPKLFLFDEPLSNLDASLRVELRAEIKRLHQKIGRTTVYVTHDQIEAMTLATKIVILNKGTIQQTGTPADIYHNPANLFVANFIGSPPIALLKGTMGQKGGFVPLNSNITIPIPKNTVSSAKESLLLGIRPEHITLAKQAKGIQARVDLVEPTGPEDILTLTVAEQPIVIRAESSAAKQGETVSLAMNFDKFMLFGEADGKRLL